MLRLIYKQLWNRRRSNGWILLELLLVFCLLWYLVDYLFVLACNYTLPSYQDTDHTWQVNVTRFPEGHPEYLPEANEPEAVEANYARILNAIRTYPGVEAIGVSFRYSTPGASGYSGTSYRNAEDTTRRRGAQYFEIYPGEDYFSVFRYSTDNGRKPVSMSDIDWGNPKAIVLNRMVADILFPDGNAVGKRLDSPRDPEVDVVVAEVVDNIKRFGTYRPTPLYYRQKPLNAKTIPEAVISIRSASTVADARFYEPFYQDMTNALRIGNFYLLSVSSYKDMLREIDISYGHSNERRIRISLMLFFILNLLLCVIGTFWYRINIRKEEIGLRVALGAPRRGIISLFMMEGLCLLSIILLPAMLIEYQFVHAGLIETFGIDNSTVKFLPDKTLLRFLLTNGITLLILTGTILAAIWLPAHKAAKVPPAEALHYE